VVSIKALEEHKALLEDVVQKLVEEKEDLASQRDHVELTMEELRSRVAELEDIVDQNQEKLNVS
jgi:peptidoglycan hydrolase CwlO-like protein